MKNRLPRILGLSVLLGTLTASSALAVSYDFSSSSQYTNNFQLTQVTSGSSNAFGYSVVNANIAHTATGSGSAVNMYDTTPDGTVTSTFGNVTVEFDFSTTVNNVSFGVYFGGSSRTSANLAIFNINTSSAVDTLRFFTGGNPTTGAAGSQSGTTSSLNTGGWTIGKTYHATLNISYVTGTTANVTYTISDPHTVSSPLTSFSATATGITMATAGEIGFRTSFSGGGGTLTLDNINIATSSVPEPSTYALLGGLGALGLAMVLRRKRG